MSELTIAPLTTTNGLSPTNPAILVNSTNPFTASDPTLQSRSSTTNTSIPSAATVPSTQSSTPSAPPITPATPVNTTGLLAQYYEGLDLTNLRQTRVDATVNFNWGDSAPDPTLPIDGFSVRWSGQILAPSSEVYTFYTNSDDGVRLWINGQLMIDNWTNHAPTENSGMIPLIAGQYYDIRMEYYEAGGGAISQLLWSSPTKAKEVVPQSYLAPNLAGLAVATAVTEQARPAFSFIDSVGLNTHIRYYDTAYGNFPLIKQRLQELGVRHLRDGGSDPLWIQRINELAQAGIKSTIVIDPYIGLGPDASYDIKPPGYTVSQLVKNLIPQAVEAVEILNEFDLFRYQGYSRNGQPVTDANWVTYVQNFTRDTYNAINSDPATQQVAVIGPSFVYPDSSARVGDLSQWVDYGNLHPYSYPAHPGNGNLLQDLTLRAQAFTNRPMIATETGYHTGGPLSDRPVSEAVQGKYIPRMFLENFSKGIYRTFSYELIDQFVKPNEREANFGILRYDGSPKPAYTALQNLIGLLGDSSNSFTPGSLTYSLSGNTQNIHHTLLQKTSGDFYLVLWQEVASTDQMSSQTVTLNLNTPIARATTYLSNYTTTPTGQYQTPTQLSLTVPDSPLIVQLTPKPAP